MSATEVATILSGAKDLLENVGFCQNAYAIDEESVPVAGLAGTTASGLAGYDLVGAMYRAASESSNLAYFNEALGYMGNDHFGQSVRGRTSDQTIIDWTDVSGRTPQQVVDEIDAVLALL